MRYQDVRLSKHFVLLDFMNDREITRGGPARPLAEFVSEENIQAGRVLCEELLEPIIERLGPCSIAAGCCPYAGHSRQSPHAWTHALGAAADVAWHDVVNGGRAPITMLNAIRDMTFERIITYAGSEFVCMAYRDGHNRHALYENVRTPDADKPFFKTYSGKVTEKTRWPETFPDRADWRREEGEPIYHTQRQLRPQHIRVSRYFTLLDFCRSERGIAEGVGYVPPLTWEPGQLWARRMGEVMDPLVAGVGRVSVLVGVLPTALMNHANGPALHHWSHDRAAQCVRFILPQGVAPGAAALLLTHPAIEQVRHREHPSGSTEFGVVVRPFEVARMWSSARPPVRARARAA